MKTEVRSQESEVRRKEVPPIPPWRDRRNKEGPAIIGRRYGNKEAL
jgi:hypothetical protein